MTQGSKLESNNLNRILLEETFYVLTKKNCVFRVRLLASGLCLIKETENSVKEQLIPITNIIGCRCLRSRKASRGCACQISRTDSLKVVEENSTDLDHTDVSAYLYIYAYLLQNVKGKPNKRERTIITLRFRLFDKFEDNNKEAQKWRTIIKYLLKGQHVTDVYKSDFLSSYKFKENRKLLVLCNPKSGQGRGKSIFQEKVAPLLQEAEIPYDLYITKHANFAREFVRTNNLFQWTGIIVVGGDGIVFEVINGLFERWDWSDAVNNIPIGVIPGGSGNGLARSIAHHSSEPYTPNTLPSTLAAVHDNIALMDLVRVETKSNIMFSFLSVGWGFLSDVDIESENLRILGGQRFSLWCLARLVGLRTYKGKLWYLPLNEQPPIKRKEFVPNSPMEATDNVDIPGEMQGDTQTGRQRLDSWYSAASRKTAYFSASADSSYQSTSDSGCGEQNNSEKPRIYGPASKYPCLTAPLATPWKCIDNRFVMVHASYQSHLSEDCLFIPDGKLNDGIIWLLIIYGSVTRSQLLQFLLGLSTGAHVNHLTKNGPIELVAVSGFRIEPDPSEQGYLTVDGEHVEYGPIQAEIFPALGRVMVP